LAHDDVMMTKLTICVKGVFHSQVVNSWLPSRDHEFTRWMECSICLSCAFCTKSQLFVHLWFSVLGWGNFLKISFPY